MVILSSVNCRVAGSKLGDAHAHGHADLLVLDMETNGGRVDTTEEIIRILNQFQGETVTYLLRDIPADVWQQARVRALKDSQTMSEVLRDFLKHYAKKGWEQ